MKKLLFIGLFFVFSRGATHQDRSDKSAGQMKGRHGPLPRRHLVIQPNRLGCTRNDKLYPCCPYKRRDLPGDFHHTELPGTDDEQLVPVFEDLPYVFFRELVPLLPPPSFCRPLRFDNYVLSAGLPVYNYPAEPV